MQAIRLLPEELVLHIFYLLDSDPPSLARAREEPTLEWLTSSQHDLKNISTTSRAWRRMVLPLLFRNCRLHLPDISVPPTTCSLCEPAAFQESAGTDELPNPTASDGAGDYHADIIEHSMYDLSQSLIETTGAMDVDAGWHSFHTWIPRFYHDLQQFLNFLHAQDLTSKVESFMLSTGRMIPGRPDRLPHEAARRGDSRWIAAATFWRHLLATINPNRISIMAPHVDMACLTSTAVGTSGQEPVFGDMEYHFLTLEHTQLGMLSPAVNTDTMLSWIPEFYPGIADASVFYLRPWETISLNEGSFLLAYGTFADTNGPPSVIHSIGDNMPPPSSLDPRPFHALRKFTYTAIFPFDTHLDFVDLLSQIHELDLQLAPSPDLSILNNRARVGRSNLLEAWDAVWQAYRKLVGYIATASISPVGIPHLRSFTCRDFQIPMLRDELDNIFTPLCLPVWGEYQQGIFTRLAASAAEAYQRG